MSINKSTLKDAEKYLEWMVDNFCDLSEKDQLKELSREDLPTDFFRLLLL